jgi:phage tail-like protein
MKGSLIRPYDFILEPESLSSLDPSGLRPYRLVDRQGITAGQGGLTLTSHEQAHPPLADEKGSFGGYSLARGVAVWRDTLFFADPEGRRVLYWRRCWTAPRRFPAESAPQEAGPERSTVGADDCPPMASRSRQPGGRELHTPIALVISARQDLVVVDRHYQRLLLFTLPGYALRRIIEAPAALPESWPARPPWLPVDVAVGPRGALYVADGNGFVWKLDAQYRLDPYYQGALPANAAPERIAVDDDGRAYVIVSLPGRRAILELDRYGWPVMVPCRRAGVTGELPYKLRKLDQRVDPTDPQASRLRAMLSPSRLRLEGRRLLLLPDPCERRKRQALETGLSVNDGGRLVLDELGDPGPYVIFVPPTLTFQQQGALILELDGRNFGNPWHRVALDRRAIERTGVKLYSLTSDQPQPSLKADRLEGPGWSASPDNPNEWLIQSPPGRYLYLGLRLIGPGDRTPIVERMYVYRERKSSLDFLPATFSADPTGRDALDRLLSLFDTIYGEIETTLDEFPFRLAVGSTPPEFLSWLASWFGLVFEAGWTDEQRRAVLQNIMQLYHWRGTRKGIELLVRLHTGLQPPLPRIIEHYRGRGSAALQDWLQAPGIAPRGLKEPLLHISVLLPAYILADEQQVAALRGLLDAFIPAHTHYSLRGLPGNGFRLDGRPGKPGVLVGVDTLVGKLRPWQLPPDTTPQGLLDVSTLLPEAPLPRGVAIQLGRTRLRRRRMTVRPCSPCGKPEEKQP